MEPLTLIELADSLACDLLVPTLEPARAAAFETGAAAEDDEVLLTDEQITYIVDQVTAWAEERSYE